MTDYRIEAPDREVRLFETVKDYLHPGSLFVRLVIYPDHAKTSSEINASISAADGADVSGLVSLGKAISNIFDIVSSFASNSSSATIDPETPSVLDLIPDYLESLSHSVVAEFSSLFKLTLFDASFSFLETVLLSRKKVELFYGWLDQNGQVAASKSVIARMSHYKPTFTYLGTRIEVEYQEIGVVKDVGVSSSTWQNIQKKPIFYKKLTDTYDNSAPYYYARPSDIAIEVAKTLGLEADVVSTRQIDIQPFKRLNMSGMTFLRKVLAPIAMSEDGESPYEIDIYKGKLLFKPLSKMGSNKRKRYIYGRDASGTMLDFQLNVEENRLWQGSYTSVLGIAFDPMEKATILRRYDQDFESAKLTGRPALGKYIPVGESTNNATAGRVYITPYTTNDALTFAMHSLHTELQGKEIFTAEAVVIGDPELSVFDLVEVLVIAGQSGDLHYASGIYQLLEVEHSISSTGFVTKLKMVTDGLGQKVPGSVINDIKQRVSELDTDNPPSRSVSVTNLGS